MSSTVSVAGLSALQAARALTDGTLSCSELIDETLDRIDRSQRVVNAFAWIREAAREDARAADRRIAEGSARAMEGVPFTVKDLCVIADGPTNLASRAFAGTRFGFDAEVVARLRASGAILVGTTTASEFGNRPTTESALFGATRNPWSLERTSGGSSGGAAVSAALGIASLNHGSDGGCSLRMPAACCGVYGLKPQRGRISLAPLAGEEWGGLDVYGPITRTVADAALFLDLTAGPAPGDPYWAPEPARSFLSAVDEEPKLRIAVAYERDGEQVAAECIDAVRRTADLLDRMGHRVEEAQPDLRRLEEPFLILSTVGIGALPLTSEQLEQIEPRTRRVYEAAAEISGVDYLRAQYRMHRASRDVATFFERYDAMLTPVQSRPAPRIGEIGGSDERAWDDYRNWMCWAWPFNCTGQPAASVPAGFTDDGIPLAVQIVGRAADEQTVLALSAQLERARPWLDARPPTWDLR